MKSINLKKTNDCPLVILDTQFEDNKCLIEFSGKSYCENTLSFYEPLLEWITNYFNGNTTEITEVNLKLSYWNSSTSQILFELFDIFQEASDDGLVINFYYNPNDDFGLEECEDYLVEFPDLNIKLAELS